MEAVTFMLERVAIVSLMIFTRISSQVILTIKLSASAERE